VNEPTDGNRTPSDGRLILVRHGETEWSRTGQHTGTTDLPLTEAGEKRAAAVGHALHTAFDVVLTSPRQRARRTAELAGFGEVSEVDDDLAEWDYGAYEGLTSEQIAERGNANWNIWTDGVPAGTTPGEAPADVRGRAERVVQRLEPVITGGGRAIVFSHSHFLRVLAVTWLQLPVATGGKFTLDTGSISALGFEHAGHAVKSWNHVPDSNF